MKKTRRQSNCPYDDKNELTFTLMILATKAPSVLRRMSLLEIGGADSIAAFNDALNADWTISGGSKSSVRLSSASLYGIAAIAHISGETPKVRHGAVAPDAMAACKQNTASVNCPYVH